MDVAETINTFDDREALIRTQSNKYKKSELIKVQQNNFSINNHPFNSLEKLQ